MSPQVAISDLTIADSLATDAPGYPAESGFGWGGGMYDLAGDVSLRRVQMFGNAAIGDVGQGGGVYNESGELKMDRLTRMLTRFNHASDDGDNIFSDISPLF